MQRFEFVTGSALKLHKLFFYNFTKKIPWKKNLDCIKHLVFTTTMVWLFLLLLLIAFDCWRFFAPRVPLFHDCQNLMTCGTGNSFFTIAVKHFITFRRLNRSRRILGRYIWLYSDFQLCPAKKIRASSSQTGTKPIKSRRLRQRGRHSTKN